MSGRGDNNKKGSSGRGSSNQSNQAFGSSAQKGKSIMEIKPAEGLLKDSRKKQISLPTETIAKKESSTTQSHQ